MTRWPTTFDSHVWATLSTPVTTDTAIMPSTSQVSSLVSPCGIATSRSSRRRNGEASPSGDGRGEWGGGRQHDERERGPEPHPVRAEEAGDAAQLARALGGGLV